jgi:integrase
MARKPFILYKRPTTKKTSSAAKAKRSGTWYVMFWDEDKGAYVGRRSTGKREEGEALAEAIRLLAEGGPRRTPLASEWLGNFWAMNSDYVRGRVARGGSMSLHYVDDSARNMRTVLLPLLAEIAGPRIHLDRITPNHLERLLMGMAKEGGRSMRTINAIFQALQVPLAEAARLGLIASNPAKSVRKLAETSAARGILSLEEAKAFFALPWRDRRTYAANLLAATAGLRLGEIRGLQIEHVHGDYLEIVSNWQNGEGLKAPKWRSTREVPIPKVTQLALEELIKSSPWGGPFVFWGITEERPMHDGTIRGAFTAGLKLIKIDEAAQERRALTFHSWRHFYNSTMRGHLPDHALRQLTGHKSEAMTDRYSHVTEEHRAAVALIAGSLFGKNRSDAAMIKRTKGVRGKLDSRKN